MEVEHDISGGLREIRVEYYERSGDALIELTWWRRDRPDDPPEAIISAPSTGLVRQPVTIDGSRSRRGDKGMGPLPQTRSSATLTNHRAAIRFL
jgi:hypothetical protein